MITSSDYAMNDIFINVKIDETNGYWCEQCECYHPYDRYTKPTSTVVGFIITKLNIKEK